ncbi:hypothetical protein [Streptomyces sp. NPDC048606]|uniref:hypothetical protein n=1 Tax=Streptomyces sp. NPDC048606 TaxID=3154726 RepID=UPI00343802D1
MVDNIFVSPGPQDVKLIQETAAVAVSWAVKGELTDWQSKLLRIGYHRSGHEMIGEATWVMDWARALRDVLDQAVDSEEGRRLVATAKDTALREMELHLHDVVEADHWHRSPDWPGYREALSRIIAADGPTA